MLNMNCITVFSILTAFICISDMALQFADGTKCYICGEGSDGPFKTLPTHHGQSSVPTVEGTCEDFRPEEKYAFECPPTYTSCLMQVDGDIETRTCGESLAINDCKSANNIDYCYCSKDLCNRLPRSEIRRSIEASLLPAHHRNRLGGMHHQQPPSNSDDEDMLESSGMDGDRSESQRSLQHHQEHHRNMLHSDGGGGGVGTPSFRDVTTQNTITLKPVPTTTDRRSKDNNDEGVDSDTHQQDGRSSESKIIPTASSATFSIPIGSMIGLSCVVSLASLNFLQMNHLY